MYHVTLAALRLFPVFNLASRRCGGKSPQTHGRSPGENCSFFLLKLSHSCRIFKMEATVSLFKCDDCDKTFKSSFALKTHRRLHKRRLKRRCRLCKKEFLYSRELQLHQRVCAETKTRTGTKTGTRTQVWKCPECGKAFICKDQLSVHKRTHAGDRTYDCRVCGRSFTSFYNLDRHQDIHRRSKVYGEERGKREEARREKRQQDIHRRNKVYGEERSKREEARREKREEERREKKQQDIHRRSKVYGEERREKKHQHRGKKVYSERNEDTEDKEEALKRTS
ncbi:hypothetical protein WMY93_033551 [Mugilogobius chulae]|uniref:C2H2-type domain-containing protein n=1 Tax=Mugilogobius chulae TaxID=88201 RepID=A0AAW0MT07_9GOBI